MDRYFWKDKKVLITGGSGFIGSNLLKELLSLGGSLVCLEYDRRSFLSNKVLSEEEKAKLEVVGGDIRDGALLQRLIDEREIRIVFHLAAQPLVTQAFETPRPTFEVNIMGTVNVLEAARVAEKKLEGVIIASTTHVYGSNPQLPFLESFFPRPTRPYETSKACADLLAQTYFYTYGLPVAMTRLTNTYGPGDKNFSRVVPKVTKSVVQGQNPELVDGTSVRDYLYVKDAVSGYIRLAENLQRKEVQGEAFNFGGGGTYSAIEMAEEILRVSERPELSLTVLPAESRKKEIDEQYVSIEKAERLLGWRPRYTVQEGLRETYDWYEKQLTEIL